MIGVKIETNADLIAIRVEAMYGKVQEGTRLGLYDIGDEIARVSSPMVPRITGHLLASQNVYPSEAERNPISGPLYTKVGYNTPYARIVHDGVDTPYLVNVREHQRTQTHAWGKPMVPKLVTVRAHPMTVPVRIPKPYLRDAVEIVRPMMAEIIRDNIDRRLAT